MLSPSQGGGGQMVKVDVRNKLGKDGGGPVTK